MRAIVWGLLLFVSGRLAAQQPAASTPARQAAASVEAAFEEVAEEVLPSVVTLRAFVRDAAAETAGAHGGGWVQSALSEDYPGFRLLASGSGFFISADGDVLTCLHHLQKPDGTLADLIEVETQDGRRIFGQVLGAEPTVNLAIVKLALMLDGLQPQYGVARFGDSSTVRCGQWAIGLGDPAGPEKFCGVGLFSAAPARDCYQELRSSFYLQAAMTAPPEAYGGPLLNLSGEVLGILSPRDPVPGPATASVGGVEFALPSNIVVGLYQTIREKGSLQSPWLGFSVMSRSELMHRGGPEAFAAMSKPQYGIYIENVFDPSPAFEAGIRPGDFLVRFDGQTIHAPVGFQRQLYLAGIGATATLELFRDGVTRTLQLGVQLRPPEAKPR